MCFYLLLLSPAAAYLNLGISFIALGKRQQAIEILQAGSKLDGATVRDRGAHDQARSSIYLQLGALYVEQGKLQRALAVYREALSSLPGVLQQREVLYQRIGDVLGRLHQWDEAERHHRAALELQPNQVAAHLSYGITLARNVSRSHFISKRSHLKLKIFTPRRAVAPRRPRCGSNGPCNWRPSKLVFTIIMVRRLSD